MCGIWGFVGGGIHPATKQMVALLNITRGTDGTGMVWKDKDGTLKMWKTADSIHKCTLDRTFPEFGWKSKVTVGHNRRASKSLKAGWCIAKNAHPFSIGKITLAHNGYVGNHESISKSLGIPDCDVDSEVIAHLLDKKGIDGLSEIRGVASVWWFDDSQKDYLFMWCWNKELAVYEDDRVFCFSSEPEPLLAAGFGSRDKERQPYTIADNTGQVLRIGLDTHHCEVIGHVKGKEVEKAVTYHSATDYSSWEGTAKSSASVYTASRGSDELPLAEPSSGEWFFRAKELVFNPGTMICDKCCKIVASKDIKYVIKGEEKEETHKKCGGMICDLEDEDRVRWAALCYENMSELDRNLYQGFLSAREYQLSKDGCGRKLPFTYDELNFEFQCMLVDGIKDDEAVESEDVKGVDPADMRRSLAGESSLKVSCEFPCPDCCGDKELSVICQTCGTLGFVAVPCDDKRFLERVLKRVPGATIKYARDQYLTLRDLSGKMWVVDGCSAADDIVKWEDEEQEAEIEQVAGVN